MNIKITIENNRSLIPVVSQAVRNFCLVADTGGQLSLNKIELAVVELLTNILDHGNLKPESEIELHCRVNDEELIVEVIDNGCALSSEQASVYLDNMVSMPARGAAIEALPVEGWGVQLIKSACDRISYNRTDQCNRYKLAFDLAVAVS